MPTAKNKTVITESEYLKGELTSEVKHEYNNGHVYAMAGASKNHGRITTNVLAGFHRKLAGSQCEPFGSDMKVKTPTGQFRYPDVLVTCDNTFIDNGYVTQTPLIIVEVISHSTRKIDEQIKRLEYINIPTLKEYVLIEQDYVDITIFRKSDGWQPTHYFLGEEVPFESVDVILTVEEIYHRVENEDMTELLESKKTEQ